MLNATEPQEQPDDLPELEGTLDEPGLEDSIEVPIDLTTLDDADALDHDDSNAVDLDIGVELDADLGEKDESAASEIVLDIGDLLEAAQDDELNVPDDESGPRGFDVSADIEELPDAAPGADEEPGDSASDYDPLDEELPALDADEEGELDEAPGPALEGELAADDPLPDWAAQPWTGPSEIVRRAVETLRTAGPRVVAGGRTLVTFARGASEREQPVHGGRIRSLALGGSQFELTLYTTALGRMFRKSSDAQAELCTSWREAARLSPNAVVDVDLCQSPEVDWRCVLARTSDGKLLKSTDFAGSFSAVDTGARVRAISPGAAPLLALLESDGRTQLLCSRDFATTIEKLDLDATARVVARGEEVHIAGQGTVLAIAARGRGVALSRDAGQSFALVPGCSSVTAIACGDDRGDALWLALYEESSERSVILRVQDGAPERIAELVARSSSPSDTLEESSDDTAITSLAWDPHQHTLWAGGGFGIVSWCSPRPTKS